MAITIETATWLARRFNIPVEEIRWYNGGVCYNKVVVTTQNAADKVSEVVKGRQANGGWFDGMPLGVQTTLKDKDGTLMYEVTC